MHLCTRPRRAALALGALFLLTPTLALAAGAQDWWSEFQSSGTWQVLKQLGLGVVVLFVGWLIAKLLAWLVYWALSKTSLDDTLAEKLGIKLLLEGKDPKKAEDAVERFVSRLVYYLVMLLVVISALDMVGFGETAGSIRGFVDTIVQALPLLGKAIIILAVAYFAGLILQKVVTAALSRIGVDERFANLSAAEGAVPFSRAAGGVIFWLIMLTGLAGAMESLEIQVVATPLRGALDQVIQILPAVAVAALILGVGYILGRLVRAVVGNLTASVGVDTWAERLQLERLFQPRKTSAVLGLVAFYLIMLQALTMAVTQLKLTALADALGSVTQTFWAFVPRVAVAGLILAVGVILGRVLRGLVEGLLSNLGMDTFLEGNGLALKRAEAESGGRFDRPSKLVGGLAFLAVFLIALGQALETLMLATWSESVYRLLDYLLWHGAIAGIILAVGVVVGHHVHQLISARAAEGDEGASTRWMATGARSAVLVFAVTMALQQLQVAQTFVLISFALLFGALCLALALAFGLGSREVAGDIVKRQYDKAAKGPKKG